MSRARTPSRLIPILLSCAVAGLATPAVVATPVAGAKTIKQGSRGKAVKALQRKLHVRADGAWGPATTRALKRFQRRNGLTANGRLDTQTKQKLGLATRGGARASKGVTLTPELIEQVQTALGITADGEWGPQSKAALKTWETENGLVADGLIDPEGLAKMGIDPAAEDSASAPVSSANPNGQAIVDAARAQIGVPYRTGGTTPAGFDCSGLTVYVFKQAGIALKRTSYDQFEQGSPVERSAIQPGDLVFFDTAGPGASHVGIATSATTVISATSHGVMEHKIGGSYWGSHYLGARRVS